MVTDDHDILPVTFDSKMAFENQLRSVSSTDSQSLDILRKSWRVFTDSLITESCFLGFVLASLEYSSAVWFSVDADTLLKLRYRVVSSARFLTVGELEFDISHRRYVTVLCMLYKIR